MRAAALGPSVELPVGPRNAVLGGADACEFRHWDRRWSSLWGHETLPWVGEPHARPPLTWGGTHANTHTRAFGGVPYGAAKRCPGRGGRMRPPPTWTFGGAPYGATKRCPGRGGRMRTAALGPSVELPMGARGLGESSILEQTESTNRPLLSGGTHANDNTGAFGGGPGLVC